MKQKRKKMPIQVHPIDVKAVDERGALHYFATDRTGEFLLVYRNAGTVSGQHYHKGISAGKNPEDMLLVQGKADLHWKDLETKEEETIQLIAPIRVKIPANIWHELTAITDIVFIELNSLSEGSEDTFRI
jgi:dTDP-4-dehydrorhamnose 3,5-epimerase-like enzyme